MNHDLATLLPSDRPPFEPVPADDAGLPARIRRRAAEAAVALAGGALPSSEEEAWRYSRIGDLDLDAHQPLVAPGPLASDDLAEPLGHVGAAGTVRMVDGRPASITVAPAAEAAGLRVVVLSTADAECPVPVEPALLDALFDPDLDAFGRFSAAGSVAVVIVIPRGAVIPGPILVTHEGGTDGAAVPSHVVVLAGATSEATVVEWHGATATGVLAAPLVEIAVGPSANLRHVQVQNQADDAWQFGNVRAVVAQEATFTLFHSGFGGSTVRLRTDCRLVGRGATGNLDAVYFGDADQALDFRTFQIHDAPDTNTNLVFTGAVGGRARSVYTGLIRIEKTARGSNAFQTNRNLKLSEDAWADSVPNLEIENNDVRCSHASTVGPVDPDQRFYLESRGVPTAVAERLVVEGFLASGVAACPIPELQGWIGEQLAARLDGVGALA